MVLWGSSGQSHPFGESFCCLAAAPGGTCHYAQVHECSFSEKKSSKLHNRYFFEFQCYSNKSISVKDQYTNLISIASGGRVIVIVSSFCLDINLNLSKFIVL